MNQQLKVIPAQTKATIINALIKLKSNGLGEKAVTCIGYKLNQLAA